MIIERQILDLIATERIYRPISSISGKLERSRPKQAKSIDLNDFGNNFSGERAYARIEENDVTKKARTMRQAVDEFADKYKRHGKILNGLIEEHRELKESNIYIGMNEGCRLTADDYISVMTNLGFTETTARRLYPELMDISYKMARKRKETERSILIG